MFPLINQPSSIGSPSASITTGLDLASVSACWQTSVDLMLPKTMARMPPMKPARARRGRIRTRQPTGTTHFQLRLHHDLCGCAGGIGSIRRSPGPVGSRKRSWDDWRDSTLARRRGVAGVIMEGETLEVLMTRRLCLVLLPLALLACRPSGPAPLSVRQPLHLEEHLDAARIEGSEVP